MDEARFNEIVDEYADVSMRGDAKEALARAVELCEEAPDDDHLSVLAVVVLDPLLDFHWYAIGSAFEAEMRRSASLRKAFSCTWPTEMGVEDYERLEALLLPGENIGREAASSDDTGRGQGVDDQVRLDDEDNPGADPEEPRRRAVDDDSAQLTLDIADAMRRPSEDD